MRINVIVVRVACVVIPIGVLASIAPSSKAQTCNHDCPVGARDAHGCCPAAVIHTNPTATATHTTTTPPVVVNTSGACGAGFNRIPAVASFMMGSPATEGAADEHPQHAVSVGSFCMARTEVTVTEYEACVTAGMCTQTKLDAACNANHVVDRPNHPINCVSWPQAVTYCNWINARLPTEIEWEYAARGTDGRRYPWGNAPPTGQLLNGCGSECVAYGAALGQTKAALFPDNDGYAETSPVGAFPRGASPFGLLDMAGNVYEWTSSAYCLYPVHNCTSNYRLYRGGSWYSSGTASEGVTGATRNGNNATEQTSVVGVRCAK